MMDGAQFIPYGTVAVLCAVALLHFYFNIKKYAPDTEANRFYRAATAASAVFAMMEFLFVFHESGLLTNLVFCYATEIVYSYASLLSGFLWFMSSEMAQEARTVSTLKNRILCSLPFAIMMLLAFTTPIHHLLFYFTEDAHYERGVLSTPFVAVTALFIAKSGMFALTKALKKENYLKHKQYMTYFYYALGLLIAQVFQIWLGSVLPFRIIGAVFVFFLVQENAIKENIFTDRMTDTNNRTAMDKYLKQYFEGADGQFIYAMIDLDTFKQINDKHGHSMGDRALILISDAFKEVTPDGIFFGRYGGDEFVMIGRAKDEDIHNVMEQARESIRERCRKEHLPFCPEFSYGIAHKTADVTSIPELMNRADNAMYEDKKRRGAHR